MKGTIHKSIEKLVIEKFGMTAWPQLALMKTTSS